MTKDCLLEITYTNGVKKKLWFNSYGDAMKFIRNEGDHVIDWKTYGE